MKLSLRFDPKHIKPLATRYSYGVDDSCHTDLRSRAQAAGYMTKSDLIELGTWKSPRIKSRVRRNDDALVREVTRIAFSTASEEVRIGILRLLQGVEWAVASVILHVGHRDPYPIIDYRALWSVGVTVPNSYTFKFWWAYTEHCRALAKKHRVSMRVLDRALWQYSKESQPS